MSFDGSANINLPGVNTVGSQNTTGNAATATTAATCSGNANTATTANALNPANSYSMAYMNVQGPGAPLIVNSTNSSNVKMAFQDNGAVRGYAGAGPATSFHVINAANSLYCLNVDNSGNVSIPGVYSGLGTNLTGTANNFNAGLGANQGWASQAKTFGSTNTNSTARTIAVTATAVGPTSGAVKLEGYIGGVLIKTLYNVPPAGQGSSLCMDLIVPAGYTYQINQTGNANGNSPAAWYELR